MITPALLSYIQTSLAAGKKKEQIKSELLLAGGWEADEVDAAFATLQTGPYKKSVGAKIGSFFLTLFIVVLIIGGLVFAAQKYYGPVISDMFKNIVAALPFEKTTAPTPAPAAIVAPQPTAPVIVPQTNPQSPLAATDPIVTPATTTASTVVTPTTPAAPIKCAANDSACLLQSVSSCTPTTASITTKTTSPTVETSVRSYVISSSQNNNQCTMTFSVKSDTNKKFSGKGAVCTLSTADLGSLLNNWTEGDFYSDTGIDLYGQCSGTYFNN